MRYIEPIYKLFETKPVVLYTFLCLFFGLVRLVMLTWDPIGLPDDHDEFSNYLQAETFANGRFSNPPAPFPHFESFHILQSPTYASKYPPGQAFFMFIGIKLFGHPWFGVLISCMLMVSSIAWMVKGYTSARWALLVGIFLVFRYALWNYWSSSYWGGAVAATGGALVFGALPRLKSPGKQKVLLASLILGLGLAFLSQTRPFEGLVVSLIPGIYFIKLTYNHLKAREFDKAGSMTWPAAVVLLITIIFTAFYNHSITGDYLKMPYQLHGEQYSVQAPLLILNNRETPPEYHHEEFSKHYNGWEIIPMNSVKDYLSEKKWHFEKFIRYFFYWPLIVLLTFFFIYSDEIKVPYWSFLLFCTVLLVYPWFHPHYFAPIVAVYYLLLIQGVRYLISHKNTVIRRLAQVGLPLFLVVTFYHSNYFASRHPGYINGTQEYVFEKNRIQEQLNKTADKHLVLVKYSDDHPLHEEWVYNSPDLNKAKVLWARYMSEDQNRQLLKYYSDRKVWLVQPDQKDFPLQEFQIHDNE